MFAEKPASIFGLDHTGKPSEPIRADRPAVVLDTNVSLDWLVFRDARVAPLAAAIEGGHVPWLACASMREELAHMLAHRTLAAWAPDRERALAIFDSMAQLQRAPPPRRLLCSDPDDQVFIDLALAGRARWLVTHDRALLKLARRARTLGLIVLTPSAWRATDSPGAG
jgi:putative PIN family toxin of toxin-antitoxin system